MKKRGMLLTEETLKIVIAVICIIFLAYFLASLYLNNKSSANLEFAEESLNFLVGEIETGQSSIEIYNPKGWVISVWPGEFISGFWPFTQVETGMPNSCSNVGWESCICICNEANPDKCDKNGFCLENNFNISVDKNIKIKEVPFLLKFEDGVLMEVEE